MKTSRNSSSTKIYSFLVFLLILLLPTQLGLHFWPKFAFVSGLRIDYYSPTIYLTDILLILIFLIKVRLWPTPRTDLFGSFKPFWLFIFLYLLYLIKVPEQWLQVYGLTRIIKVFLFFWIILNLKNLKPVFWGLVGAVSYTDILAIAQFLNQKAISGKWFFLGERWFTSETPGIAQAQIFSRLLLRPYATFSHPNSMAGFLLVSLWLILYLNKKVCPWRTPRTDLYRLMVFSSLLLSILGIFLSFSQTAWITLLITLTLFLINFSHLFIKKLLSLPITYYLLLITSLTFPLILLVLTSLLSTLNLHEEIYLRNFLAKKGIEAFISKPFFGQGINHFIRFLGTDRPELLNRTFYQPIHNIFWLILAETGLVGLFFALKLSSGAIYRTINLGRHKWRHYNLKSPIPNPQSLYLSLALISIFLLSATDHYFLTLLQNRLLLGMFLGLAWREKRTIP